MVIMMIMITFVIECIIVIIMSYNRASGTGKRKMSEFEYGKQNLQFLFNLSVPDLTGAAQNKSSTKPER